MTEQQNKEAIVEPSHEPLFTSTIHERSQAQILSGAMPFEVELRDKSGLVVRAEGATLEDAWRELDKKIASSTN